RIVHDARLLQDAAAAGLKFTYVGHVGMAYRDHRTPSLSRSSGRESILDETFRSASELHRQWQTQGTLDEPRREALKRIYQHVTKMSSTKTDRFTRVVNCIASLAAPK